MSAQAAQNNETTYDEIQYESYAYAQSHPDQLYTIGTLFGLTPPDFRTARILEIGCAGGGNILPLALAYPRATFLGFDLSQEQIAQADRQKKHFNLRNITFRQDDIMAFDLEANKGKFDYIICHGVYSWVPEPVRAQVLKLCNACLSPRGLAVISYNVLPGWNGVRGVRDMMLYHTRSCSELKEKIDKARDLLDFLIENVSESLTGYRALLEEEREIISNLHDSYIFHEHLESFNTQFYLHEFVAQAAAQGLAYVGDSTLSSMFVGNMPQKAMETLSAMSDFVEQEQYMDFVTNRRFRFSILCKTPEKIRRDTRNEQIMDYFICPNIQPEGFNRDPSQPIVFRSGGVTFTTNTAAAGALFLEIAAAVRPVAAKDLLAIVQKKLRLADPAPVKKALLQAGMQLALRGFITLRSDSPVFVGEAGKKPMVAPLARYQAGMPGCVKLTNMLNGMVNTDALTNAIITHLDGQHTVEQVIDALTEKAARGQLAVWKDQQPVTVEAVMREELGRTVRALVPGLAKQALLVK